ncbi:P-loop NTPase fold protein [Streptomyces sp. AK02-01A]|uniref:P-loop NTPase fold protein n=1 Tax=Streptomyces sp. AK02-01A TaxID=3028648 RepID=UPI0029BCC21D|nr:P-loop NTPase fold protein [Streptomyces sp. AK02-01A]MDX3854090.1 P-loop NTPase fold protein [Streptomyces sp. AK02-01A]
MRILAQPARRSDKTVERHFQDTVARPVVFSQHADLLDPPTLSALLRLFPNGSAQMWGVMPGKNGANLPEIRKMAQGDWVFFSGDKRLYFGGTVALTWRNPELAARLWGSDAESGDTWEYMYALSATRDFDIPIEEVRELLGWKPTRNVMRFQAFTQDESDLLQRHYSLTPPALASISIRDSLLLPGLHSDSASPVDLLDNEADVDMLAKLAIAKITTPPLAVALLGEWGAGKSSFINQMSRRVDELAEDPSGSGAFNTTVRQVHFNAWHYSDDHVWSGLVDHLFRFLAPDPEPDAPSTDPTVAQRERLTVELRQLETEQRQLDKELARTERARPRGFLGFLGSPVEGARLLYTAVRLGARDGRQAWLYLLGWMALIGGVLLTRSWLSAWLPVLLAALAAFAAPVLPLWMAVRRWHPEGVSLTGRVRSSLEERRRTLRGEITTSRAQLAEIDAAVRLSGFLTERGDTYQERRGLLGTVHQDLFQLDEKLREAHAEWSSTESNQPPPLERIILYIDDLDRCPPPRVVEVLAAVHLMLALPLFVVVVAVDPRWLLKSLEHHYSELFTDSSGAAYITDTQDSATPLDYLDKIFQVPFVVPPATPEKIARLIATLLETPAVPNASYRAGVDGFVDTEVGPSAPADPEQPTPAVDDDDVAADNPVQLQLIPAEIAFMSRVGVLTQTPRAAKKLVNLYRLARIGVLRSDLPRFEGEGEMPGEHQVVQILLALLVGSPHYSSDVFRAVLAASPSTKITEVLRGMPDNVSVGNHVAELIEQINVDVPVIMDTAIYQQWCPKLARFSFFTRNLAG